MNQRWISVLILAPALPAAGPFSLPAAGQGLPVRYEELSTPDFIAAVQKAQAVCIIPLGILEKHGPHLPLGTGLLVDMIRSVKADRATLELQNRFFKDAASPLTTPQGKKKK